MKSNVWMALLGNVSLALSRWSFFIIVVKFGNQNTIGRDLSELTIATAICGPVFLLLGGGLRHIVAVQEFSPRQLSQVLKSRVVTCIIAVLFGCLTWYSFGFQTSLAVLVTIFFMRFADSMSEIVYATLQRKNFFGQIAIFKILRSITSIGLVTLGTLYGFPLPVVLAASGFAWWWQFFLFEQPCINLLENRSREDDCSFSYYALIKLNSQGLLLSMAMSLAALNGFLPSFFLAWLNEEQQLAIFGSLYCFVVAQQMVYVSLGQSLVPQIVKMAELNDRNGMREILFKVVSVVVCTSIAASTLCKIYGGFVLCLVYSQEFSSTSDQLALLLLAGGFIGVYSICGSALTANKLFGCQIFVSVAFCLLQCLVLVVSINNLTITNIALAQGVGALGGIVAMSIIAIRNKNINSKSDYGQSAFGKFLKQAA